MRNFNLKNNLENQSKVIKKNDNISREELRERAAAMAPSLSTFLIMTAVSAVIAATGLLTNSAAVIIGAMVIAPLMGPAMATGVGTVIGDFRLSTRGIRLQAIGIITAVFSAALFALIIRKASLIYPGIDITSIPEVRGRLVPDVLSLLIALGSGIAASISLARGVSSVLVGAMIAVALVPPAAAVGLGIVWGVPLAVLGAGVLLLVNLLAMNLVSLAVFWYLGYKPENLAKSAYSRSLTFKRIGLLIITLALLGVILASVTYISYQSTAFEFTVKKETKAFFRRSGQRQFHLLETKPTYRIVDVIFFKKIPKVVLLVAKDKNLTADNLAVRLDNYLSQKAGRDVNVQIRFLEVNETGG